MRDFSEVHAVVGDRKTLEQELKSQDDISTSDVSGILECTCFMSIPPQGTCPPCSAGYDWGCVYQIAENFAVEIAICGTCTAAKKKTPCAACMGYAVEYILSGGYENLCCPCRIY